MLSIASHKKLYLPGELKPWVELDITIATLSLPSICIF